MANIEQCIAALKSGEVIAYPTESVFGLGCCPDNTAAIKILLDLKNRPKDKGLILIAADVSQLEGYVDFDGLSEEAKRTVLASWPGAVTWVMPAGKKTTDWISGHFDTVAVRVSKNPDVQRLCLAFGKPIISTSANLSGKEPCQTIEDVLTQFGNSVPCVLTGKTSGADKPTQIRDACTGRVLREG